MRGHAIGKCPVAMAQITDPECRGKAAEICAQRDNVPKFHQADHDPVMYGSRRQPDEPEAQYAQQLPQMHGGASLTAVVSGPLSMSCATTYKGRFLTSSYTQPRYSPRTPIEISWTPEKNIRPAASVAQPGTSLPKKTASPAIQNA